MVVLVLVYLLYVLGYKGFHVMKVENKGKGNYTYVMFDDSGKPHELNVSGAGSETKDPLRGICNIDVKIDGDQKNILGVKLEDDCAERIAWTDYFKTL